MTTRVEVPRLRLADAAVASPVVHWILRVSVWACFVGHGLFGIRQKMDWLMFYQPFGVPDEVAFATMPLIGLVDITLGYFALFRPTRVLLMYTAFWGLFTALLRPLVGLSPFEALERGGNVGPSLALLLGTAGAALWSKPDVYDLADHRHYRHMAILLAATTFLLLLGHGALALGAKPLLVKHWASIGVIPDNEAGVSLVRKIGAVEAAAALLILLWPTRVLCLTIVAWKLFTEMLFVVAGDPPWEVLERGGSYGAPLALFVVLWYGSSRADRAWTGLLGRKAVAPTTILTPSGGS